jgi:hypothetical protein
VDSVILEIYGRKESCDGVYWRYRRGLRLSAHDLAILQLFEAREAQWLRGTVESELAGR